MQSDAERDSLVIIGASARAAAQSALRAGIEPVCVDLFGDADLCRIAATTRVAGHGYPENLVDAVAKLAPGPWMYVGAIENRPDLVARICRSRPLWGNGPDTLVGVRDPFAVADCLRRHGLPCVPSSRSASGLAVDGSWLVKPLSGAGGTGIRPLVDRASDSAVEERLMGLVQQTGANDQLSAVVNVESKTTGRLTGECRSHRNESGQVYFQRRVAGLSCAAVFVANGQSSVLLGVTEQMVGQLAFNARPFHYCGSVGPFAPPLAALEQIERVGETLSAEFRLVGLFGVDGILEGNTFWPVEVNPRYTASVEALELADEASYLTIHREACLRGLLPPQRTPVTSSLANSRCRVIGKAVLFAPETLIVPDLQFGRYDAITAVGRWPIARLADIPNAGERIDAGRPICTVFAAEQTMDDCRRRLVHAAQSIYAELVQLA